MEPALQPVQDGVRRPSNLVVRTGETGTNATFCTRPTYCHYILRIARKRTSSEFRKQGLFTTDTLLFKENACANPGPR